MLVHLKLFNLLQWMHFKHGFIIFWKTFLVYENMVFWKCLTVAKEEIHWFYGKSFTIYKAKCHKNKALRPVKF